MHGDNTITKPLFLPSLSATNRSKKDDCAVLQRISFIRNSIFQLGQRTGRRKQDFNHRNSYFLRRTRARARIQRIFLFSEVDFVEPRGASFIFPALQLHECFFFISFFLFFFFEISIFFREFVISEMLNSWSFALATLISTDWNYASCAMVNTNLLRCGCAKVIFQNHIFIF